MNQVLRTLVAVGGAADAFEVERALRARWEMALCLRCEYAGLSPTTRSECAFHRELGA